MAEDIETLATPRLTRKRRQTRDRLLSAALDAFADRGFHGTSVEDICDRAGFSRGAFYSNFGSKDELLLALYQQQADRLLAAVAEVTPAGDGLTGTVARFIDAIPQDRRWFLVNTEFVLHAVRNPAAAPTLAKHRAQLRAGLAGVLTGVLDRLGRQLTVDVDELVRAIVALHEGGLAQAYLEPDTRQPTELMTTVVPRLLDALAPPKGRVET